MAFVLSSQNVSDYLVEQGLCTQADPEPKQVELKAAKNFNLLFGLSDGRKLLVKQERHKKGKTTGEILNEWRLHEFLSFISEVLYFNANDSVIVLNYLNDYYDLAEFYT